MKIRDQREKIRNLSMPELVEQEKGLRDELFNLQFQHGTGQLTNPMQMKQVKREIARIKTELGKKTREAIIASGHEG